MNSSTLKLYSNCHGRYVAYSHMVAAAPSTVYSRRPFVGRKTNDKRARNRPTDEPVRIARTPKPTAASRPRNCGDAARLYQSRMSIRLR